MPTETDTTLRAIARELVGDRRGILAADESIATMSIRLEKAGVTATETSRRDYRELLVTTPDLREGVSGVILCDETLRQKLSDGRPFSPGNRRPRHAAGDQGGYRHEAPGGNIR